MNIIKKLFLMLKSSSLSSVIFINEFRFFLFIFLLCLPFSNQVYAFSLEDITVKSSFGEKFYAEVIVKNDGRKDLKIYIGNAQEYSLLNARRPKLVDELSILEPIEFISINQQLIKIVSQKPLFYPSFDLIIKATLDDGTLLQKYSLAVDYKKNMSITLSSPALKGKEFSQTDMIDEIEAKKVSEPAKRNIQENLLTYTVAPGDTLSSIVRRVSPQKFNFNRAVVALWKLNKDKFAHNNINGLEIGARLSFVNLDEKMGKTTSKEARQILYQHWKEWKKIRMGAQPIIKDAPVIAFPLPGENITATGEILGIILQWKQSWKNEEMKKHFSYYSEDFLSENYRKKNINLDGWKQYKDHMNSQNKIASIDIKSLHIRKEGKTIIASFLQKFSSGRFISFGTKTITFERKDEQWKINKELFRKEKTEVVYKKYPFVIHASSHKSWENAVRAANHLRKSGFSAYVIKSLIPKKGEWFRVVVDRFRTKNDANYLAKKLIENKFSSYSFSLKLPYAISVGSFKNEAEAYKTIQKFRKKRYSPYLFSIGEENEIIHFVLVGGYNNKKKANNVSKMLAKKGVTNMVIQP